MLSPPSKPNFACSPCRRCMCSDCLSIAAEHEFLAATRSLELMATQRRLLELESELALALHLQAVWKELAHLGQAHVIQMFLDFVVWERVCKPPKRQLNRKLKRLEADIRQMMQVQGGDRP